ncbi:aluminum-activated malate transporter 5 [Cannabis sativa]|uniref:aluminum-activated malate transporter 5 n=1 Tax=Cannabis sativa TaxID=3483 RepID=UPI0029C9BB9A|nr:aluminum-activated malate transporter 5 [Cannabis sativa]XP_060958655.1 aluminum-activated malate transporter 5 [Cannabis sativa]
MDPMFGHNFAEKSKERLLFLGSFKGINDDVVIDEERRWGCCTCFQSMNKTMNKLLKDSVDFAGKAWEMGRTDPRKAIYAMKMGLAMALVSLLIFWKDSYHNIDQYSVWAILTVIVMFEFSIGATLIKGFNRGLGTLMAAILAFVFAQLSLLAGKRGDVVIVISIFIVAFFASYLRLYPTMKPYDYGYRVFVITFCILMLAGNRTGQYNEAVISRLVLIALGAGVCFVVNVCIFPIWSGEDLHTLVVKNFKGVASSLEGCVKGYLECIEYERIPSKILTYQAAEDPLYKGYRTVVQSSSQEETLLGFAVWEPPHGRYRMYQYPWENYVKVSGAVRHCAFTVMALHGCILSEIQASAERRQVFRSELQRVGSEGAKVLRLLGNKVENMEKLGAKAGDILHEVHVAAEQLQKKIDQRSYLLVNSESWEIGGVIANTTIHHELQNISNIKDHNNFGKLGFKSLSETVLNLGTNYNITCDDDQDEKEDHDHKSDHYQQYIKTTSSEDDQIFVLTKQTSWPLPLSFGNNINGTTTDHDGDEGNHNDDIESKTYQSASALSLATFASLLIEFVARLQNVVDSFEELSEKAGFTDPMIITPIENKGLLSQLFSPKFIRCFGFKS